MRFPFQRRFTIESALSLDQATSRLGESIGGTRTSLFERTREPFMGVLRNDRFDIIRTTYGRNSVRPRIRGQVEAEGNGTTLHGTMKVHELVLGFFALLVLGPWFFIGYVWLAGMILLLVLFGVAFNHESSRALRMLAEIVDAERSGFE